MVSTNKSCKEIEPLLDSYYDKELDASEITLVEKHLSDCADCQIKLESTSKVVSAIQSLPKLEMKNDLSETIEELIAAKNKKRSLSPIKVASKNNVVQFRPAWSMAAVAAVIVLFIAYMTTTHVTTNKVPNNLEASKPENTVQNAVQPSVENNVPTTEIALNKTVEKEILPAHKTIKPETEIANNTEPVANTPSKDKIDTETFEIAVADTGSLTDALGLSTDEDGLYDLKM